MAKRGRLTVHVKEASLMHDTELFGDMDPYCKILCGGTEVSTQAQLSAGKKPKWNEVSVSTHSHYFV